jgi:hypothetical protein
MQQAVAGHALERRGDGGRSDAQLFGQPRADRRLLILEEFPDGLEVVFARNAGGVAWQEKLL